jgi:putative phosphoribosyl transferase
VLAVPVAPQETLRAVTEADEVVCVETPHPFLAVGHHYLHFEPTSDDEVVALLASARPEPPGSAPGPLDTDVVVRVGSVALEGHLHVPAAPIGVVAFAHGSGSSRHSPRNQYVASVLQQAGLATLLLDLLTPREETDRRHVFDIPLLAGRLAGAVAWLAGRPETAHLPIGLFGASTGAAAALWAAAEPDLRIGAVVSRGGRPDLAGARLGSVRAPTLLIVGSRDTVVLGLNHEAQALLRCRNRLSVVDGASHLFEEPGTLAQAAALARDWFVEELGGGRRPLSGSRAESR